MAPLQLFEVREDCTSVMRRLRRAIRHSDLTRDWMLWSGPERVAAVAMSLTFGCALPAALIFLILDNY